MEGLKPTVAGLIGAAAVLLMTPENFTDWKSFVLFAAAFIAQMFFKTNAILIIIVAGVLGYMIY